MYTLLINENNEIVTTVKERIMQRSKLVDHLHFLMSPNYKGIDMSDFTVLCEYISPISREYHTETLSKSNELYKDMLEYKVPFDTCLTKEPGKIEIQLSFIKVEMDAEGNVVPRVRKAGPAMITIVPLAAWSNAIPDSALTAIDQRLIMAETMINAANDTLATLEITKADNMVYDQETNMLQLTANGMPIGDRIALNVAGGNTDVCIKYIEIDDNGNLIVTYSDDITVNVGPVGGSCTGIYIPDYEQNGVLTFTLKDKAEKPFYSFDINPENNWYPVEDPEADDDYIWEEL